MKRRHFIKSASLFGVASGVTPRSFSSLIGNRKELFIVTEDRKSIPVFLPENASEATKIATEDLIEYIYKISGVRPSLTRSANFKAKGGIWIGNQSGIGKLFPGLDTKFKNPEEILIACNGRHLLIAGQDKYFRNKQVEYGTANAIYTFIQKYLDVRWLWPGESGEDFIQKKTISLPSFEYRFYPGIRRRRLFARILSPESDKWLRFQRLKFDSLEGPAGGHAYTTWWERFHKDHPEWFALQPDGTRSGYPAPRTVKMCLSNPEVWDQWLKDAVEAVEKNPELTMIMAGENDGHSSGVCVCKNCRAWDDPNGAPWKYSWEGSSEDYIATTDRYITYWNHIARMLKERFPDRTLYVQGLSYGPSTPPPVKAVPADNVIISYVGKFPTIDKKFRADQKTQFKAWAEAAPHIFYRPNLWYWTGGAWGLPDITLKNVSEDFRFLGENNCIGLFVDTAQEHWSTQAPQYYLMTQLTWDPMQDAQAILHDYYQRGFGKAADKIKEYFNLLEEGFNKVTSGEKFGPNARDRFNLLDLLQNVYTSDFFKKTEDVINQAEMLVSGGNVIYKKRISFIKSGMEFSRTMISNIPLMKRVRESKGNDAEAINKVTQNWESIKRICEQAGPVALSYRGILGKMQGTGYMGSMENYFGPVSEKLLKSNADIPVKKEPTDID